MLFRSEYYLNFYSFRTFFLYLQDKATLEESLELFVAEELFSGDNKLEDPDAGTYCTLLYCTLLHCTL